MKLGLIVFFSFFCIIDDLHASRVINCTTARTELRRRRFATMVLAKQRPANKLATINEHTRAVNPTANPAVLTTDDLDVIVQAQQAANDANLVPADPADPAIDCNAKSIQQS